jgi:hypothetical protein
MGDKFGYRLVTCSLLQRHVEFKPFLQQRHFARPLRLLNWWRSAEPGSVSRPAQPPEGLGLDTDFGGAYSRVLKAKWPHRNAVSETSDSVRWLDGP